MYAIVDIETTGGSPKFDKITEIAIYLYNGQKIVDEFITLINPECNIPSYITNLTGITNQMVAGAPRFYEVAKQIVELTENKLFVAHNAVFDYNFIKKEFNQLGYQYKRKQLCTLKLSRKLIPHQTSYSLGKLCGNIGIPLENRHRAAGDALATVKLLERLLTIDQQNKPLFQAIADNPIAGINPDLPRKTIDNLPEKTGVYYFYNEKQNLIYVGKSKNIKERVLTHLRNETSSRALEMRSKIRDIDFEITGSELIALLKESEEIKYHKPLYNRAQRRSGYYYGLYHFTNQQGYICFQISKNSGKASDKYATQIPLTTFHSHKEAETFLYKQVERYELCQKLCGLYDVNGACFHYGIKQCKGACIGEEPTETYNEKAAKLIEYYNLLHNNCFLIDTGRNNEEKAVIYIANGKLIGYGFVDVELLNADNEIIKDAISKHEDNRDVQQIIRTFIRNNQIEKIIDL